MSPRREPLETVGMREIAASAIRAARQRAGLDQAGLAQRMTNLGWPWHRQTVGAVEAAERKVAVEELLPLSLALECSISDLIAPMDPVHRGKVVVVHHQGDQYVTADDVVSSVGAGRPMSTVKWAGDDPRWTGRSHTDHWARGEWRAAAIARREAREHGSLGLDHELDSDVLAERVNDFLGLFLESLSAYLGIPRDSLPAGAALNDIRREDKDDELDEEPK